MLEMANFSARRRAAKCGGQREGLVDNKFDPRGLKVNKGLVSPYDPPAFCREAFSLGSRRVRLIAGSSLRSLCGGQINCALLLLFSLYFSPFADSFRSEICSSFPRFSISFFGKIRLRISPGAKIFSIFSLSRCVCFVGKLALIFFARCQNIFASFPF